MSTAAGRGATWREAIVHPPVVATAILVASIMAVVSLVGGSDGEALLASWLVMGMAAGFAVSGSV